MESPLPFIIAGIVLTAVFFLVIYKISGLKGFEQNLSTLQKALFGFIIFYTPVQLIILLTAGHKMQLANPQGHNFVAISFTLTHALMAVMGMVVCAYLYKRYRPLSILMAFNAVSAVFYFLSASIFIYSG